MWDKNNDLTYLYEILQERYEDVTNILLSDNNHLIQIMSKTATKETALLDIFKEKYVDSEKVVAIGDDLNDLGMIQRFGCGIAMGNAVEEVKNAATYVTLTNDEHGVSYALRDILGLI
jgi:hydroxymethylpyrimidine pyrophosphatase-like HAD family hydrolase